MEGIETKRYEFAKAAMQGILANPNWNFNESWASLPAIQEADEILKELSKGIKTDFELNEDDKESMIQIMSNFETRANKDIQFLMRMAYQAGQKNPHENFEAYQNSIKRLL